MTLRIIDDNNKWPTVKKLCLSSEHNPPSMYAYEGGKTYEWTCPNCGEKTVFSTPLVTC